MTKSKPQHMAFTTRFNGRTTVLYTKVTIGDAYNPQKQTAPAKYKEYQCIWDTGATNSVITLKVAKDLQLQPTGMVTCQHAGGSSRKATFLTAILLPNRVAFPIVKATEGVLPEPFDVLIGMDIIGSGDFAVTKEIENTVLTYQYPSDKTIDFVKRIEAKRPAPKDNRPKGSSKKSQRKRRPKGKRRK